MRRVHTDVTEMEIGVVVKSMHRLKIDVTSMRFVHDLPNGVSLRLTYEMKDCTSKPMTPSRSPTAFARTSQALKNALCRNVWIGTSSPFAFLTFSFGAKVSPAQKHVLQTFSQLPQKYKNSVTYAIVAAASF